jgi:hypothetical protein
MKRNGKSEGDRFCPVKTNVVRWGSFGVFFAKDLLVLAAYYPGIFSYDIILQTDQALGITEFSRFHPPLHTFIWKCCIEIGSLINGITGETDLKATIEHGMTVYGLLQSVLMALVLSEVLTRLFYQKMGLKSTGFWGAAVFFIFYPLISIFDIIPTKDALFAVAFLALMYRMALLLDGEVKRSDRILFCLNLLLCCLLRNNFVYAAVLSLIVILILQKKQWKKITVLAMGALIPFFLIQGPMYTVLGVEEGDVREALAVPLQQIAHVYVSETEQLTEDEIREIGKYIDTDRINTVFNPRFADYTKTLTDPGAFTGNWKKDFFSLYFSLLVQYPDNYINEALALNVPLWYPFSGGIDPYSERDYIETFISDYPTAQPERDSKLPGLLSALEQIADFTVFDHWGIRWIFSMAMPFWGLMLALYLMLVTGKKDAIALVILPLFFWLTFLGGPVSCMRYIYPLMPVLPIIYRQLG